MQGKNGDTLVSVLQLYELISALLYVFAVRVA